MSVPLSVRTAEIRSQIVAAIDRGDLDDAERLCRTVPLSEPSAFPLAVLLGDVLARRGRQTEALAAYEIAAKLIPGHALPFSRAATLRFRGLFGPPPAPRVSSADSGPGLIQMTTLGANGRFGNQLLQYAFVRIYAQKHNLTAEFPDWIGRDIFDLDDPLPSRSLPAIDMNQANLLELLRPAAPCTLANRDISGYLCGDTGPLAAHAAQFRDLFRPGKKIQGALATALNRLQAAGRTLVAIHMRLTDFGTGRFWVAPAIWYLAWLRSLWLNLDHPVLYVAADDSSAVEAFDEFSPWHAGRIGESISGADFLLDHYLLGHADFLAIANSTFSLTAALLNTRARTVVRPHPDRRRLVPFDPWHSPVVLDPVIDPCSVPEFERWFFQQTAPPGDCVLYVGQFCSPWTHFVRSVRPGLRVLEAEPAISLDEFCRREDVGQIAYVKIEDDVAIGPVLIGARAILTRGAIGMLHFCVGAGGKGTEELQAIGHRGYRLFLTRCRSLEQVEPDASALAGHYLAVHRRLLPFLDLILER